MTAQPATLQPTAPLRSRLRAGDHRISGWDPEHLDAWNNGGHKVARRNLIWSIFAEHIGFSVWSIWSVMVLFMPQNVYHIDPAGKFYLVAVPTLVGALLRLPYTTAVARFGGRNWTIVSALLLLIPLTLTWWFMVNPGFSYTTCLFVAAFAGFGGGNFASSMTNINAFYPVRLKGWALGLNAGGGNIGVPVIQLVGLLVIATAGNRSPQIVCAAYLVLVGLAALGAALFMDNLDNQKSNAAAMLRVMKFSDTWLISFLYIGTFGSFIGYSFAFGQVLQINYLTTPHTTAAAAALRASQIAFLGPLLGSLSRPIGGRLADRIGGAKITMGCFVAMVLATGILVIAGIRSDSHPGQISHETMVAYVLGFILLFLISGLGNGSVYKMIPSIFAAKSLTLKGFSPSETLAWERSMSGALIGIAGAVGALGGVGINVVLRASYAGAQKSATTAFWVFLVFYLLCLAVTWLAYVRPRGTTSLA
ncbi:MAG: NarK/NasA family nitrate transporter [Mycobacterium sp.]|uniref:nitrate/nitrite transporter n=1 Tax=Mycobacterium sp. TaxID=1785 RepID=UPI001ECB72E5|nr:nitrate/nitrite transporter [Mycobacterium sp.]MBV8785762.1 NarK/NasA family nitrate transporter [Mycobacterium sp.]